MPRCPNGSRRNKKTGKCVRTRSLPRCPRGSRRNKTTLKCVKNAKPITKPLAKPETKNECMTNADLELFIIELRMSKPRMTIDDEMAIRENMAGFCAHPENKMLQFYNKPSYERTEKEELMAQARAVVDEYLKYRMW